MADNNEAESKKIAKLSFNVDTSNLESINKTLKEIAEESKGLTDKISKNLQGGIDSKIINSEKIKKQLSGVEKITEGSAKKLVAQVISEETKLANNRKKNADNQVALEKQVTTKLYEHEEKINDKIKLLNAKKNAQIEVDNNKAANKQIANNNRVLKSTETMYDKIIGYAKTYLIYQGFNELKRGIQETIDEMVNVQYQMVQIDRVLNDNSLNIDDYRDKLMQLAYDYGNSFSNVSDITLRLAQAGFDADESLALTEKTLLALNTAELNATQATSDMVAVMAQWGLMTGDAKKEAKDYGDIIDKINKVADNFPTTSEDILNALKKTSSAFNIAGASIDETIATIVAAEKASQRGGKVIGTALSNIVQQLRAEGKLDLAEQLGLDFFEDDAKTKFKPLMEIFGEMSNMMQKLKDEGKGSSIEMQHLLEMFTVFRRNIGASLLGEMAGEGSTYQKVLETSINSVGYSLAENEKHMRTAKAAQEQFNAELLKLKTEVWDNGLEDVFRSMLLLGSDVVNSTGKLVETFGALPTVMAAATLAFSLFSKKMKIAELDAKQGKISFTGLFSGINNMKSNLQQMNNMFKGVYNISKRSGTSIVASMTRAGKAIYGAKIKTMALKTATMALNAAASIAATAGVMLLTSIVQELAEKTQKATALQNEAIQSTEEMVAKQEEETSTIEGLVKEYDKLAKKEKRNPEDVTRLYEIQSKIKGILGEQADTIDLINGKYEDQMKILNQRSLEEQRKLVEEKRKLKEQKEAKGIEYSLPSKVEKRFGDKDYEKVLNERNELIDGSLKKTLEEKSFNEIKELLTYWERMLRPIQSESLEISNTYNWVTKLLNDITKNEKEAKDATEDWVNESAKLKLMEMFPEGSIKNVEQFNDALKSIKEGNFDVENVDEYKSILTNLISDQYPEFVNQVEAVNGTLQDADDLVAKNLESLQGYVDGYNMLIEAQKEYNSTGEMTISTLQGLINNNLLQYLSLEDGQLRINTQSMLDLAEAKKVEAIEALQSAAANDIQKAAIGDVENMSNIAKGAIAQFGNNAEATGNQMLSATSKANTFAASLQNVINATKDKLGTGVDPNTFQRQANAIVNSYANMAKNIANINITTASYSPRRAGGSRGSSGRYTAADRAKRDAEREQRERERAAEEARRAEEKAYKERLKKFEDYLKEKERLEKRWVKKQEDLGLLTNTDYLYITEQRIKRHKEYLDEIKKATWMNAEDRLELEKEYSEKIEDLQLDYMDYLKKQLEDNIKNLEESNEKQMDLINKEADKKIQALRKVEKETDRIREKEEYERRRKAHLDDISYWEQRTGREAQENLLEAKKRLKELDREWKETQENWNTEDQIKQIESARDAEIKAIEDQQKAQIEAWQKAYDEKVKMFAETGKIIYDGTVMQSEALYNAYKQKFIDPIKEELANLNKSNVVAPTKPTEEKPKPKSEAYIIQWGDTLSGIARKFGTTIDKIMQANPNIKNKNRIYAGSTLQIPKFHNGGEVGGTKEGYALLKPHEMILKPKWAAGVEKLANMAMKSENNAIGQTTNIEVKGDLVKMNADIKNKGDVDYMVRKVEKMLKDKFNIKK